jgi:hypothetical protein
MGLLINSFHFDKNLLLKLSLVIKNDKRLVILKEKAIYPE